MHVHFHTLLQQVTPQGRRTHLDMHLPAGATVGDALARLALTYDPEALALVVNRREVEPDHPLQDGDRLDLIPAIAGG
ncbi:MAG: MoaD/ThiS family protein [Anaerolineae bacterium]|nr:MoaD/ThiS family protein [Anaerolineae bacterium]